MWRQCFQVLGMHVLSTDLVCDLRTGWDLNDPAQRANNSPHVVSDPQYRRRSMSSVAVFAQDKVLQVEQSMSFGDLFEPVRLHFNEEGSRRLAMSIAPLFLPALLAWSLPDSGEAGPMPQCFSAPALSEKEVLAYGDSLTAGFYMAGQGFSPYGEALSRELGDVEV